MFMRAVTNGSLIERDMLIQYSIGSFYRELQLFILEQKNNKERNK